MPGRVHSREFKLLVCRQLVTGEKRPAQVCREHNLDQSVVSRWRKEFDARGEAAFDHAQSCGASETAALEQRIGELERHCAQLSLENAVLKKLLGRSASRSGTA